MRYMIYFADGVRMIIKVPFIIKTISMACYISKRDDVIKFVNF